MTETDFQLSKVQLQAPGIPGEHAAYDTGERWNGAVCPLFDREQAESFAEAYSSAHENHREHLLPNWCSLLDLDESMNRNGNRCQNLHAPVSSSRQLPCPIILFT